MRMLSGEETPDAGRARRRPQRRHAVLRAGRSDAHGPGADRLRDARVRLAERHGAGHPQHPRRLSLLGRRRLQARARAVGRRADAAGRGAHAAATVEHAPARRADQPPRSRLEGSAARRARRLRRHADLRVARSVLRRTPGHEDHRGRRRHGRVVYPGTYKEFLWHKAASAGDSPAGRRPESAGQGRTRQERAGAGRSRRPLPLPPPQPKRDHAEKKRADAEARRAQRAAQAHQARIDELEAKIAACENAIREIEQTMSAPGFYDDRAAAQPVIDRHQALMWEVGDLMHRWEELQATPADK